MLKLRTPYLLYEQLQGVPYGHYFRTRTSCSLEAERPPASPLRAPPLGGGVQKRHFWQFIQYSPII